jgi:hypothetical protein
VTRHPSPDDAAAALSTVEKRQRQVVDQAELPTRFWWATGILMVAFAAAVDSYRHRPAVIAVLVVIFIAAILGLIGWSVRRAVRAPVSNRLLGPRGVLAILAFIGADIAISLSVAFVLQSRGFSHPATAGVAVGAVLLALGGPRLMAYLRGEMLTRARTMR